MTVMARRFQALVPLAVVAAALALGGCGEDDAPIRTYTEPKGQAVRPGAASPNFSEAAVPAGVAMPAPAAGPQRMITAIIPHEDQHWFFKLQGPPEVVKDHVAKFDQLIQSVRFVHEGGRHVDWKTPEGWQELPPSGMRAATFRMPPEQNIELSVIPLPPSDLLGNVNRWRGQIGLPPTTADRLTEDVRQVTIGGEQGWVVDISGPGTGAPAPGNAPAAPPTAAAPTTPAPAAPPLLARPAEDRDRPLPPTTPTAAQSGPIRYTPPEGWVEGQLGSMRAASFVVQPGNQQADFSVIPLAGAAGGPLDNVNRWRGQISLPPISQQEFDQQAQLVEIGGKRGYYFHLVGPESVQPRQGILAAFTEHDGRTWFFKMQGPAETVAAQKPAFEAFIRSTTFAAGQSQ